MGGPIAPGPPSTRSRTHPDDRRGLAEWRRYRVPRRRIRLHAGSGALQTGVADGTILGPSPRSRVVASLTCRPCPKTRGAGDDGGGRPGTLPRGDTDGLRRGPAPDTP